MVRRLARRTAHARPSTGHAAARRPQRLTPALPPYTFVTILLAYVAGAGVFSGRLAGELIGSAAMLAVLWRVAVRS